MGASIIGSGQLLHLLDLEDRNYTESSVLLLKLSHFSGRFNRDISSTNRREEGH
jgi:hypothetical protein